MPTYEYEPLAGHCDKCQGHFEIIQKMSEPHLKTCPACGQAVKRVISGVSIGNTKSGGSYADAKKAGFTVMKRRDKGVYEKI